MEEKEVKLEVKNLTISFRTTDGKVQAVRDIDFELYKGETLAIVGESGSGKSVTTRAILGILAVNAIKEGGEILYDGQDLMKISEESFHKIRGDKIAMIFQDPLSSLNPIMRIGKQMTEAMLIKGRLNQRESRRDFNRMLAALNRYMDEANGEGSKAENKRLCADFDRFERKHLALENEYNRAREGAEDALAEAKNLRFELEKKSLEKLESEGADIAKLAARSIHTYVVSDRAAELKELADALKKQSAEPIAEKAAKKAKEIFRVESAQKERDVSAIIENLDSMIEILNDALAKEQPNFFSMGYYLTFSDQPLPDLPVPELNAYLHRYLDDRFMLDFIKRAKGGVIASARRSTAEKKAVAQLAEDLKSVYAAATPDKKQLREATARLAAQVEKAIDPLEVVKDNVLYTFRSSVNSAIDIYFNGAAANEKEERRYAKQKASYDRQVANGKMPDWKVEEKKLVDLEGAKKDVYALISRLKERCERDVAAAGNVDFDARTVAVIDYLKEKASNVAYKVTKRMAKNRALKLLDEVGIPEPRKRFNQYPFEFSGGMRQRIVIAIALSANPDILICDEPTTALDVTIQSMILELINKVKRERKLSVIFITHDLGVVANMADRVAVMYAGKIVEIGTADDIFYSPAHPYTWALLSSMPDLDTKEKLEAIPGTPPNMIYPPKGDAFAERNKYAMQIDFEQQPPMFRVSDTHYAATWLLHPDAPKVDLPKTVADRIARMKKLNEEQEAGGER